MSRLPPVARLFPLVPGLVAALGVGGCTTFSAECHTPVGDPALTPARVSDGAPRAIGQRVTWGGTLVAARNLESSTELEVLAQPLGRCGRPRSDGQPLGRFVVVRPGYLETAGLSPGRPVTATGTITDVRDGQIGSASYRFPLLTDPDPRLWPDPDEGVGGPTRPVISIGIGGGWGEGGWGWRGGGVGVSF